jgi:hypothetical protein
MIILEIMKYITVCVIKNTVCFTFSLKTAEKATISLAKVGCRAALNFSFAFLRRAWRSGILLFL